MAMLLSDPTLPARLQDAKQLAAGALAALAGCPLERIRVTEVVTVEVPRRLADPTGHYHATIEVVIREVVAAAHGPHCGCGIGVPGAAG